MSRAFFVSALLVAAAITAAAQLSPEVAVGTPEYGPAVGEQTAPVIATNGSEFLVAWIDGRAYPPAIYANRVTADGRRLDGTGIRIPIPQNAQLVGLHFIDGAYTLVYTYQKYAGQWSAHTGIAIISADGKLIDGPRATVDQQAVSQSASNGSRIVFPTATHEFAAIDSRGNLLGLYPADSTGIAIASNGTSFLAFAIAPSGTSYVQNLIGLDPNGKPQYETPVTLRSNALAPVMASDGTDYLVVYGATLRINALAQIQSTSTTIPCSALVWTGSSYLGIAMTPNQEQAAVVVTDRNGVATTAPSILGAGTPGRFNQPAAAWNGREALLTWMSGSRDAPYGLDIAGATAGASGSLTSAVIDIPTAANTQQNVAIATSGQQDLIAWAEPSGIYASRVTAGGVSLDGRGIAVAAANLPSIASLGSVYDIHAIDDGSSYIVAWGANRTWDSTSGHDGLLTGPVTAQRIAYSGARVGEPFMLSPCSRTFDLVMGPDAPVLFHTPCSGEGLVAQKLGGSAVVISNMSGADWPRASWNGGEWLIVWNNLIKSGLLISPPVFFGQIYAARMSAALTLIDTQPIAIDVSDVNVAMPYAPLVASDGRDFFVAWSGTHFDQGTGLYGRSVRADGSLTDQELFAPDATAKSLVWTGRRYAIAYVTWSRYGDVALTYVDTHEQVAISATDTAELDAELIAPPGRPMRVVYTRVAPEPEYGGVPRAFIRDELLPKRRSIGRR